MSSALKISAFKIPALKWIPLALATAIALSGCARDGFYDDRNLDYADVEPGSPLSLPETRNTQRYSDALPVPQVASPSRLSKPSEVRPPRPLMIGSAMEPDYVERREMGSQTWLVVDAAPGAVWPQLESFVRSRGLNVQEQSASQGLIDTRQGRIHLQSALRAGGSEVRCEQGGQASTTCLDALETYLGARTASASAATSWTAQRREERQELQLRQQEGEWNVVIPQTADRVWAEIHHYLAQDFTQEGQRDLLDVNPDQHEFLVEYMTLTERNRNPLQIVLSADVRQMPQEIRIVLEERDDQTVLRAINASDRAFTDNDQRELLERVAGYLR